MKYQFTQKAKDKKKETIQKLEKHLDATHWLFHEREQLCQDEVHLLEPLLEIQRDLHQTTYEEWETLYIKHGWEKVKPSFRPILRAELENLWLPYTKEEKIASYISDTSHIFQVLITKSCFKIRKRTLKLFKDASFNLNLLELHDTLYTHEAFLILRGISPDDVEYREIATWMTGYNYDNEDYSETFYDAYPEWRTIERQFKNRIKGIAVTGRTEKWEGLKEAENEQWIAPSEIDTQSFIRYVEDQGYIEEANNNHHRDGRQAPYEESFSKMLHKELLAHDLIKEGKHHHEWEWNTTAGNGFNSFNYLGRLLALNMIPMKYWLPLDRNSVSWENLEHYIIGVKNPKNQVSMPNNARVIEGVVMRLMEEHDKRPLTEYQDLD